MNTQTAETERGLLGYLLLTGGVELLELETKLSPGDFNDTKHQAIYAWMLSRLAIREPVSAEMLMATTTVADQRDMGGGTYVWRLGGGACLPDQVDAYAEVIAESSRKRRIILLTEQAKTQVQRGEKSADVLHRLESGLLRVTGEAASNNVYSMADIMRDNRESLERSREGDRSDTYVKSGLPSLDKYFDGWCLGFPHYLGGLGKMGKTLILATLASRGCDYYPQGICSLEMNRFQLSDRMTAAESGVPWRIGTGEMGRPEEYDEWDAARERLSGLPIHIDDTSRGIAQVAGSIRRMARIEGCKVVYIDYLTLIQADQARNQSRSNVVDRICDELRAIAKAEKIALVILAQFNNEGEHRTVNGKKGYPVRDDWRESKKPLMDGSLCFGVYREFFFHPPRRSSNNQIYTEDQLASRVQPIELVCLASRNHPARNLKLWGRMDVHQVFDPEDEDFTPPSWG